MDATVECDLLLGLTLRIGSVGVLLQSAEILWTRRELKDDGLLGWSTATPAPTGFLSMLVRRLQSYPGCAFVLATRALLAGACLVIPLSSALIPPAVALLVLAQLYYHRRFAVIGSDSDTMQLIALGAVLAGTLPGSTPATKAAALGFLAAQVLIAYFASGLDKATTRRWRSGERLTLTFQYSMYRRPSLGDFLARRPDVARLASGGVILLELLFPLCVVLPDAGLWLFLAGGLAFHATVAVTMGLHGFFWSFAAAYPGLYFVHAWVAAHLYAR